jgi:OOP family OmpA-OmpF porin
VSRSRSALALAAVLLATGGSPGRAQNTAEVRDLTLPVLDLDITTVSLDDTVSRSENGSRIDVVLSADVLFAFNRARLAAGARSRIGEAVTQLKDRRPSKVTVTGYTDAKGSPAYNLGLSRRRAAAVARALRSALGSGAPPLKVVGRGEADPVRSNTKKDGSDDPRGRARNRRVEITFPKRG